MYSEFGLYAGRGDHVDNYSKAAAAKAFEHLLSMELLQYVDARWGCCLPAYLSERRADGRVVQGLPAPFHTAGRAREPSQGLLADPCRAGCCALLPPSGPPAAHRNDTRPGARQYAAVQVAVQGEDLESGLAQHWNCPSQLGNWLRKEAGLGTTAGSFLGV